MIRCAIQLAVKKRKNRSFTFENYHRLITSLSKLNLNGILYRRIKLKRFCILNEQLEAFCDIVQILMWFTLIILI